MNKRGERGGEGRKERGVSQSRNPGYVHGRHVLKTELTLSM